MTFLKNWRYQGLQDRPGQKILETKVKNSDRFLYLDLRKSRLQAGLDKHLVLELLTLGTSIPPEAGLGILGTQTVEFSYGTTPRGSGLR